MSQRRQELVLAAVGVTQRLLHLFDFTDVGVGAEPVLDTSLRIAQRIDPCEERTELSVGAAEREDHIEWLAGLDALLPALHDGRENFGVVHGLPAPAFHLLGSRAGVLVPALVVPEDVAVGPRHPG